MSLAGPASASLAAHARTDPRVSKLFAGRYILGRELGRGGMGAVYAAFDSEAMRWVALKRIEPRPGQDLEMLEQRFRREVRALAASKHPGTPWLLHCDRADRRAFYTMEIIVGEPLRGLLARERLDPVRALSVAIALGEILASMHAVGVVHRDVKPGNILIEAGDRVRLVDFGACAFLPQFFMRDDLEVDKLTATVDRWATGDFDAVHTPGYSAPEVGRDDAEANVRNDIYSLCAITYEMVAGRPLFDRQALRDRAIVAEEFAPELAPLAPLLASGASHEAFDRQRSMAELVQGLEIMRTGLLRARASAPPWRSGVVTAALAVAAAAVLFAGWTRVDTRPLARVDEPAAAIAATTVAPPPAAEPRPSDRAPEPAAAVADASSAAARTAPRSRDARRRRILAGHGAAVQRCVDSDGGIFAQLRVALTLEAGRIDTVTLVERAAPMLERCVRDALRGLQLPSDAPRERLIHSFTLRP